MATGADAPATLDTMRRHGRRLPVTECLRLGLHLTSALGHLHRNGLIHRDAKPSNIVFVQGAAKLADIGLVAEIAQALSFSKPARRPSARKTAGMPGKTYLSCRPSCRSAGTSSADG